MPGTSGRPASKQPGGTPLTIRNTRVTKRVVAAVATAALGATLLALPASPVGATQTLNTSVRLEGADRYATASTIAAQVGCASDIILVSGENQPDALAAAALARKVTAPILLTPAASLSASASNFIGSCVSSDGAQTVHILGGEAAMSADVAASVEAIFNVSVNRIEGLDRYETAVAIANAVGASSIGSFLGKRTVFVASGTSYVDALAAGPVSYAGVIGSASNGPHPILLTAADALPASTDAALTSLGVQQVVIMGGTAVVSDAVEAAIEAKGITVIRIDGANRNATAAALAEIATTSVGLGGFGFDGANLGLANGTAAFGGFDALAAAPYLGKAGAPLVLTGSLPAETQAFIESKSTTLTTLHVLGGTAAVTAETQAGAEMAATLTTPTAVITAEQGRESFTVVFSEAVPVANVALADFNLNNTAVTAGPTASAVDPTGTPAVATTFTVSTLTAPLATADSVRLNGGTVATADGRTNASVTVVVAPDTVKPVATILVAPKNSTFQVSFSEPVTGAGSIAPASYFTTSATGGVAFTAPTVSLNAAGTLATVTPSRNVLAGDKVGIVVGVIADTAGNFAVATSKTVVADNVAPTLNSATVKVEDSATASLIIDNTGAVAIGAADANTAVEYTAKAAGTAGNGISVAYAVGTAATDSVAVTGSAIVVTQRVGGSTAAQIAAAVTANVFSSPLVTAEAIFAAGTTPLGTQTAVNLAGGVTKATVVATFSEVVNFTGVDFTVYSGGVGTSTDITVGDGVTATAIAETSGTSATYTITITGPTVRPGASATLLVNGGTDLATNPITAKSVTMTAAA